MDEWIVEAASLTDLRYGIFSIRKPFVRCKDCKFHGKEEQGFVYCYNFSMLVRKDFYCGGGRPKDEAEK